MGQFDSVHKFAMTCGVQKSVIFGLYNAKAETNACVLVALTQNKLGLVLWKMRCCLNCCVHTICVVYLNGDCCIGVVQSIHSLRGDIFYSVNVVAMCLGNKHYRTPDGVVGCVN